MMSPCCEAGCTHSGDGGGIKAMTAATAALLFGLMALAWSADLLVKSSVTVAHGLGIAPLMIGMIVIGFATSAPEMIVSTIAAWSSGVDLALGNALGSNIANIALVLGVTAIIRSVPSSDGVCRRELPSLVLITLLLFVLLRDQYLGRLDGVLLLALLGGLLVVMTRIALRDQQPAAETGQAGTARIDVRAPLILLFISLIILMLSARLMVWGAVVLAHGFGVSELIIGLSVVAIGTSLPELAASIASALRGHHELAMGNILGSNVFNSLAVIGLPAVMVPGSFDGAVISRDLPWVMALTLLLWLVLARQHQLGRLTGALLLITYMTYQALLFMR